MPLVYRTAGTWGAGKGSNLTPAEVDGNFYFLDQLIETLSDALLPVGIDEITMVGNQLTFTLTDTTTFGPFTTPTAAMRWRGAWADLAIYVSNDVVTDGTAVYLVLQSHTAAMPFDPARVIGGLPVYEAMLAGAGAGGGGGISQVITTASTEYTPDPADDKAYFRFTSTPDVLIPDNADVPLPVGWSMMMRKVNAPGSIVVFATGIATLNIPTGFFGTVALQGGVATLVKVGTDEWDIFGDLGS